jgi:hypothetical protein
MRCFSPDADGSGRLVYDHYRGLPSAEVIEHDDGWFGAFDRSSGLLRR